MTKEIQKYLFLDIDGVLNTGRSDHLNPKCYGHHFDNEAVKNLRWIIDNTGAKIVISSSWRHLGLTRLQELWRDWNLPGEIVGCTPGVWGNDEVFAIRGAEIQRWLDEHVEVPFSYVVIDDFKKDEAIENQKDRWISVNPHCGLSMINAIDAIIILNEHFPVPLAVIDDLIQRRVRHQIINCQTDDYDGLISSGKHAVAVDIPTCGSSYEISERMIDMIKSLNIDSKDVFYAVEIENRTCLAPDFGVITEGMDLHFNVKKVIAGTDGITYEEEYTERLVYKKIIAGVIITR